MNRMVLRLSGLTALMLAGEFANAQERPIADRLSWEIRTGANFASEDLGDADLDTGVGLEGAIWYEFRPRLLGYFGWGWDRFTADNSFAGADIDFEETGYNFGLQLVRPVGASEIDYYIRVGGIYKHIELENDGADVIADTDHGLGWQVGAGLQFSAGEKWRIAPGLRYQSLSRDILIGGASMDLELAYTELGVGFSRSF